MRPYMAQVQNWKLHDAAGALKWLEQRQGDRQE